MLDASLNACLLLRIVNSASLPQSPEHAFLQFPGSYLAAAGALNRHQLNGPGVRTETTAADRFDAFQNVLARGPATGSDSTQDQKNQKESCHKITTPTSSFAKIISILAKFSKKTNKSNSGEPGRDRG